MPWESYVSDKLFVSFFNFRNILKYTSFFKKNQSPLIMEIFNPTRKNTIIQQTLMFPSPNLRSYSFPAIPVSSSPHHTFVCV